MTQQTYAASSLLRCIAGDAIGLNDLGELERDPASVGARAMWSTFIVDLVTGVIRKGDVVVAGHVTQVGDAANDTIIVIGYGYGRDLVAASSDFVRIRRWSGMTHTAFLAFQLSSFVVGTCEEL